MPVASARIDPPTPNRCTFYCNEHGRQSSIDKLDMFHYSDYGCAAHTAYGGLRLRDMVTRDDLVCGTVVPYGSVL